MNINLGNEETEFNGHREGIQPLELVETTSLDMEVQSYRDDNERLIKSQEEENQINN
jgi:hypothetical protein